MRPPTAKLMFANVLLGLERAGDPQRQLLVAGLDRAGGLDDVLRLQRGDQRRAVDAETGELLHRELDEDPLVLRAQDLDLRDVGDLQQLRANVFDIVAKLAMGEAVGGEAVDDAERVAEIVVEARADDAGRQRVADIADALADVIPDVRRPAWRSCCPCRLTKIVVTPALVKLRRKSRCGVSCSLRSSRSVTCFSVSSTVAPGQAACTTMVLMMKVGIFGCGRAGNRTRRRRATATIMR